MQTQDHTLWRHFVDLILRAPLEPILDASSTRLKYIGVSIALGQLFFGWVWLSVFPQPFESLPLRLVAASLGLLLFWDRFSRKPNEKATEWLFGLIIWFELPVIFMWLYFQNSESTVWFGSVVAMILAYYQLTDWRLATIGLLSAGVLAILGTATRLGNALFMDSIYAEHWFVFLFAWASALVLAFSAANQRRKRLDNALTTMGVVAHELRTPLAALSLLGDALRGEPCGAGAPTENKRLDDIAARIYALSRAMNQQIDMQIANASLMHLTPRKEVASAIYVVRSALGQYPFHNARERDCVRLELRSDFQFEGSQRLFAQVLLNLLKNAFRALAAHQGRIENPEIFIEVTRHGSSGIIRVGDTGVGIEPRLRKRIFEPFFSTQSATGHGLGLAFCRAVVVAAKGQIEVTSAPGAGATFSITLPVWRHRPAD